MYIIFISIKDYHSKYFPFDSSLQVLGENPAEVIQSTPSTDILGLFLKHAFAEDTSDECHSWIWMAITKLLHSMAVSPEIVHSCLISLPPLSMSSETQQVSSFLVTFVMMKPSKLNLYIYSLLISYTTQHCWLGLCIHWLHLCRGGGLLQSVFQIWH